MNPPIQKPLLERLSWTKPKRRDNGEPYGTIDYSSNGQYVYRRYGSVYWRATYAVAMKFSSWIDVPEDEWKQVDVFGIHITIKR